MDLEHYLGEAEAVEREGTNALTAASDLDALENARVSFLGDRQGRVKVLGSAQVDFQGRQAGGWKTFQ